MAPAPSAGAAERGRTTSACRLLATAVLVAGTATAPLHVAALGAGAVVALAAVLVSGGARRVARSALAATLVVAATAVPVAFAAGPLHAALLALRALVALTTAVAILGTIAPEDLAPALAALGAPRAVAAVVAAALRQTVVLQAEGRRLLLARQLRGGAGYRESAALLGVLLSRAAARAGRIELSARLRGHCPDRSTRRARLRGADAPYILLAAATAIAVHLAGGLSALPS
jgi:energy-coupling factor transporter transmembrane protein EcfT